ncbi:MAG: hypothetical protein WD749_04290 [Phycisphaerales bacterium]
MLTRTLAVAALAAALLSAGCYERTVSASGFAADRKKIDSSDSGRVLGYPKTGYKTLPTTR